MIKKLFLTVMLLLFASNAEAVIRVVGSMTTTAGAFDYAPVSAHNALFVAVACGGFPTSITVVDDSSNAYTRIGSVVNAGTASKFAFFYAKDIVIASSPIQISIPISPDGCESGNSRYTLWEIADLNNSTPIDVHQSFDSSGGAVATAHPTISLATNGNNELILAAFADPINSQTVPASSIDGSFTKDQEAITGGGINNYTIAMSRAAATATTYNAGVTNTSSNRWVGMAVALVQTGSPAPSTTTTTPPASTTTTTSGGGTTTTTSGGGTTTSTAPTTTTTTSTSTTLPCPGVKMSMKGRLDCQGILMTNQSYNIQADVGDSQTIQQGFKTYNYPLTSSGAAASIGVFIYGAAALTGETFDMRPVVREINAKCSAGSSTITIKDNGVTLWVSETGEVTTTRYTKQFPAGGLTGTRGHDLEITLGACGASTEVGSLQVIGDSSP